MNSKTATKAYLEARKAFEQAELIKKQAEAQMKEALAREGVTFSVVDGVKVALVQGERPNYDAETLRGLVNAEVFETVTKVSVDGTKMKSAIKVGMVAPEVAEAITEVTYYEQVRVTELADAKADAPKVAQVA